MSSELEDFLSRNDKAVVEFYSERCVACRTVMAILDELSKEYPDIAILKIDVTKNREIAKKFGVIALPVLIFFKNGVEVDRIKGAKTRNELKEFLERNW
jgi:thioredoxin 1